jgi:hypothetical protein
MWFISAYNHGMRYLILAVVALYTVQWASACDFTYGPAAATRYYRAEGWKLPGTMDFNSSAHVNTYGLPIPREPIPGVRAEILSHDDSPYVIELPAQTFLLNGTGTIQRMRAAQYRANVLRWMINHRIVAYSYGLSPVIAHRENNKWIIESEAACIFNATFIDDKGDGVFRVLVSSPLAADLVPEWAKTEND